MARGLGLFQRGAKMIAGALLAYAAREQAAQDPPGAAMVPLPEQRLGTPPAPGFGGALAQSATPHDRTYLAQLARTVDALFGRVSQFAGPTETRWSTFNGQFTPESIADAINLANAGYPYLFADQCERAIENDAHLGGILEQRISGIINKPDRVEPPEDMSRDWLAISVANWMRAVKRQIENFDDARFGLLWADGQGYAAAENVYDHRVVTWHDADGKRRTGTYLVQKRLETVHPKHFIFHQRTGEPLLWLWQDYLTLPPAKFVFHRCFGFSPLSERRGFMRSCIYLHAMKHWDLRDMAIFLHVYGLPQQLAEYDARAFTYEQAREIVERLGKHFGQGNIPTVDSRFNIRDAGVHPQGALVHSEAAQFLNGEMSKRVLYSNLTVDSSGGPGSYGLGEVHENQAFDGKLLSAMKLCGSIRDGVFKPALELNVFRLAAELQRPPVEIRACLPAYSCRIDRETSPLERLEVYERATKIGLSGSKSQLRHDVHLDEPKDERDTLLGETETVPSGGKVVGAVEGSEGATAPPKPNTNEPPGAEA